LGIAAKLLDNYHMSLLKINIAFKPRLTKKLQHLLMDQQGLTVQYVGLPFDKIE